MRDVLPDLLRLFTRGETVALATVIKTKGTGPRPMGSKLLISETGEMVGSVSGGCVEGAVATEARSVIETGAPKRLSYGITDDEAWAVGLSCGGELEVFVERVAPDKGNIKEIQTAIEDQEPLVVATVTAGEHAGRKALFYCQGKQSGSLGKGDLNEQVAQQARLALEQNTCRFLEDVDTSGSESSEIFLDVLAPQPRLIIIGAVHTAMHLVTFARELGFYTLVLDARAAFATAARFPETDELVVEWPATHLEQMLLAGKLHEETYFAFLSHDQKLDNPALQIALKSRARYVGALGSRKTHEKRCAALEAAGVDAESLTRIMNPIGLKLGGRRPPEIAAGIAAQLVQARYGRL